MGSEQNRFPLQERWKKWIGCCFSSQRGGKRIVPASRNPEGNASVNQTNGAQAAGLTNQATSLAPSLLAPPSSPASFSNSAIPSTAQSPSCYPSLSASSPGGPSNTMYATGPYAHETQLVSPPVFSTFTTEPSTAPLTPPPELAHLTTPSSPDVPYAHFLSSTLDFNRAGKGYASKSDLQATYPFSPESPQSTLLSPVSGPLGTSSSMPRDANFFCPETFAQFYLDQPSHAGGRLSISKESDMHSGNVHHGWQNKNTKQDAEELEAYRASFGFSADEMITTAQYVEIADVMDESFTMLPPVSSKLHTEVNKSAEWKNGDLETSSLSERLDPNQIDRVMSHGVKIPGTGRNAAYAPDSDEKVQMRAENMSRQRARGNHLPTHEDDIFSNMSASGSRRKYDMGLSYSDAEVDYRRGRSLREGRG